jgi:AraC-like DNA-binding protein
MATITPAAPHPALAPYVRGYVQIEGHEAATIRVAAQSDPTLLLTWNAPVQLVSMAGGQRALPLVVLAGASSRAHTSEIGAGACGFHVRFTPAGARALTGERPPGDTWDAGLPADLVRWAEAVAEASGLAARVALADAFWRARMPERPLWSAAAVALVRQSVGTARVASVAAALGVVPRTLRRRFHDDAGVGIKAFMQVERYRQAHGLMLRAPGTTWQDVCERFGYADQAHFVRDFRRFTGETPTRWLPEAHSFDIGFGLRDDR